ncbi:MAG: DUF4153 domain-containing protein [Granulosicoccaceae bacterium]
MNDALNSRTDVTDESAARTPFELVCWFLVPGILQGCAFYLLIDQLSGIDFSLRIPLFWFVVTAPTAHFLITTHRHRLAALITAVVLALGCSLLAYWYGVQLGMNHEDKVDAFFIAVSMFCTIVISAAVLPFYRTRVSGLPANDYPSLFKFSWNQVVSALVALFFALAVYAILALSSALFQLIGIEIDKWIWRTDVRIVVFAGAYALGIGICRTRDGIINGVRYLIISLMRALLPVFVLVTGAFVVVSGVNGLDTFTDDLSVTGVMLTSLALSLTLCSAAVGDSKKIESRWLSLLCRVLAFLMAALCVLAIWAMWQRVVQHGFTDQRVLAVAALALAAAYTVGYLAAAFSRNLSGVVQQTNIVMIFICSIVAILLQTPLLLPQAIAAKNQLARFESGSVSAEKLDIGWLKFEAGLPGAQALDALRQMSQSQTAPLKTRLTKLDSYSTQWEYKNDRDSVEMQESIKRLEAAVEIVHLAPVGLVDVQQRQQIENWSQEQTELGGWRRCPLPGVQCVLVEADAFADWNSEYLFIMRQSKTEMILRWVVQGEGSFKYLTNSYSYNSPENWINASAENIDSLMESARKGIVPLGAIQVPAVKLGDKLVNPYDEF